MDKKEQNSPENSNQGNIYPMNKGDIAHMDRRQLEEAILLELSDIRTNIRELVQQLQVEKQLKNDNSNYNSEP